jgi:hypothetical protein
MVTKTSTRMNAMSGRHYGMISMTLMLSRIWVYHSMVLSRATLPRVETEMGDRCDGMGKDTG